LCLLVTLALLCGPTALAQDVFDPIHIPAGNAPLHVSVGDIDADGLPDVACTTSVFLGGSGAFVFRNLDGFHLDAPVFYSGGTDDVLLADLDADGRADLCQAQGGFNKTVTVRMNDGNGAFGEPTTYVVGEGPADIDAVDLNEDGIVDLAVSCEMDVRVAVLIGAGDGSFAPAAYYGPTGDHPRAIAEGDLDGDGHLDIVVANTFDTTVSVMLGAGDGSFGAPVSVTDTGPSPEDIVIGDLDEDGNLDVAVIESSTGLMRVLFGGGDGSFTGQVTAVAGSVAEALVLADFDEDGHLDLAGTSGGNDTVAIVLGNGDGSFQVPRFFGTARDPFTLAAADFNQDGDLDLVTGNFLGDNLTLLFGNGDATFSPMISTGTDPRGTAAADFDGDGRTDLAVTNQFSNDVAVLINQGGGRYRHDASYAAGSQPVLVLAVDVTGDGVTDLVTATEDFLEPGVQVLAGIRDGSFVPAVPQVGMHDDVRWMDAADLDGNGSIDLVYSRDGNPGLIVSFNDGSGGFSPDLLLSTEIDLAGVAVADATGDGLPDLIVGRNSFPAQILVFPNTGGAFGAPIATVLADPGMAALRVADLDDNGTADIVTVGGGYNRLRVLLGAGDGTFGSETAYVTGSTSVDVALGDFDGDGLQDVITANQNQNFNDSSVSVFLGQGGVSFGPETPLTMGKETSNVTVADLDGDGVDDAVVSVTDSNHVALLFSREGPWKALTKGLGGTHGIPRQSGTGTLLPGEPFAFTLTDALEGALTSHVVGLSVIDAPFKGGTMVPLPLLINKGFLIGPDGTLTLAGTWPAGGSGLTLSLQFWVHDPTGPVGYSASNAVSATIP
jgi:hypothetical protein